MNDISIALISMPVEKASGHKTPVDALAFLNRRTR